MRIIWLRLARKDIEDIRSYHTEVAGKDVADKIITKIIKSARLLSRQPYIGHVSSKDSDGLILEWVVPKSNYILPYSIVDDEIQIYRVFDSRQKPVDSWEENYN